MAFFDDMNIVESRDTPAFNTNTMYDLVTGCYVPGVDGKWYLNGGLSQHINSFAGPNGAFKSTIANALNMRVLSIYPNSAGLIMDTENSLDKDRERAYGMAEQLRADDLEQRVKWIDSVEYNIGGLNDLIISMCAKKEANKKDFLVESPFIDRFTGKALVVWVPHIVFVDSLTELHSIAEDTMITNSKKSIDDESTNTLAMRDANKKTIFLHYMRRVCQKHGIIFVSTGHYDKTIQMDMYNPNPRETTFSKQDWKTKGCGSKYKFLSSTFAKTTASVLLDNNKDTLYGGDGTNPAKDLAEVSIMMERCKTQSAGNITPFVASQSEGFMNDLSNYHYLRTNDYYGLNGNKLKQQVALYPDVTISRNTCRGLAATTYELSRALELTAQYCYIRTNWRTSNIPLDFSLTPAQIYDKLNGSKEKTLMQDILNSRGYWTYAEHPREYMSILDVLALLNTAT